jgi:hypothetical protein
MMALLLRHKLPVFSVALLSIAIGGVYSWYRQTYPLGRSHCCDKQLITVLFNYADRHDGQFPAGGATPEASLSKVHLENDAGCAYLLCGKTGSESAAQAILDRGNLLGPKTCGWNYVAGLRSDDRPDLALFWDKEGLGHNGERLPDGGHIVMFVSGFSKYIPAAEWKEFLVTQSALRAARLNVTRK